jgi:hypothetical protein
VHAHTCARTCASAHTSLPLRSQNDTHPHKHAPLDTVQILSFLSSSSPVELAEYGLGAVALYLLSPLLLGGLLGGIRGYAGDITAVQALEAINGDSNAVIVDIRTPVRAHARARACAARPYPAASLGLGPACTGALGAPP